MTLKTAGVLAGVYLTAVPTGAALLIADGWWFFPSLLAMTVAVGVLAVLAPTARSWTLASQVLAVVDLAVMVDRPLDPDEVASVVESASPVHARRSSARVLRWAQHRAVQARG